MCHAELRWDPKTPHVHVVGGTFMCDEFSHSIMSFEGVRLRNTLFSLTLVEDENNALGGFVTFRLCADGDFKLSDCKGYVDEVVKSSGGVVRRKEVRVKSSDNPDFISYVLKHLVGLESIKGTEFEMRAFRYMFV